MQRSFRVDVGSGILPNGSLNIMYTIGEPPLPAEVSGQGIEIESRQAFKQMIEEAVAGMSPILMLAFAVARIYRSNPNLPNSALAQMIGETVTLDLVGSANPVIFS